MVWWHPVDVLLYCCYRVAMWYVQHRDWCWYSEGVNWIVDEKLVWPFFLRGSATKFNWGKCVTWSWALRRRVKNFTGRHTFLDMNTLWNLYEHVIRFMHATPYISRGVKCIRLSPSCLVPRQKALACLATLRRGCVRNLAADMRGRKNKKDNPHPTSPADLCEILEILTYIERWVGIDESR